MGPLSHQLNRSVFIEADREVVFRFFCDTDRWAKWWGAGSAIEAHPGGAVFIRYPNGVEVRGEVLELSAPERFVFSYGYVSGKPIAVGASRVTIALEAARGGTFVHLLHEFPDDSSRDAHVQGWRFQLSLFGNAVADELHAGAADLVDAWFSAWSIRDDAERRNAFGRIASETVSFRDRYSLLETLEELNAHAAASQRFMPGIRLERTGPVRHCQSTVLAEWAARSADGATLMSGFNVFTLSADRRIRSVTGLT